MFLPRSRQLTAMGNGGVYLEDQEDQLSLHHDQEELTYNQASHRKINKYKEISSLTSCMKPGWYNCDKLFQLRDLYIPTDWLLPSFHCYLVALMSSIVQLIISASWSNGMFQWEAQVTKCITLNVSTWFRLLRIITSIFTANWRSLARKDGGRSTSQMKSIRMDLTWVSEGSEDTIIIMETKPVMKWVTPPQKLV